VRERLERPGRERPSEPEGARKDFGPAAAGEANGADAARGAN